MHVIKNLKKKIISNDGLTIIGCLYNEMKMNFTIKQLIFNKQKNREKLTSTDDLRKKKNGRRETIMEASKQPL